MGLNFGFYYLRTLFRTRDTSETGTGEMAEWFKAHAWKACLLKGIEGSNPSLSANRRRNGQALAFLIKRSGSICTHKLKG